MGLDKAPVRRPSAEAVVCVCGVGLEVVGPVAEKARANDSTRREDLRRQRFSLPTNAKQQHDKKRHGDPTGPTAYGGAPPKDSSIADAVRRLNRSGRGATAFPQLRSTTSNSVRRTRSSNRGALAEAVSLDLSLRRLEMRDAT